MQELEIKEEEEQDVNLVKHPSVEKSEGITSRGSLNERKQIERKIRK